MIRRRPQLTGLLIGLVITVLGVAWFYFLNPDHKAELFTFDYRVRHFNDLEPDPRIVHVDIDDNAIRRVGRWPWHRDRLARLVAAIDALGAELIVIDLLFDNREPSYIPSPAASTEDIEPDLALLGESGEWQRVYSDLEFARALRETGDACLAMQFDIRAPDEPPPLERRLADVFDPDKKNTIDNYITDLGLPATRETRAGVRRALLRLHVRPMLLEKFTRTVDDLAAALDRPPGEIETVIAGVKSDVAETLVARQFTDGIPDLDTVLRAVLGDNADRLNADRTDVCEAYRRQLALAAIDTSRYPLDDRLAGRLHRVVQATPPYYRLARAARRVASVNFSPGADYAVRRVPLVLQYDESLIPHLGFAAVAAVLDIDLAGLRRDGARLIAPRRSGEPDLRIPLDDNGNMIIPWTRTGPDWKRGRDMPHISAAKLWQLIDARGSIAENQRQIAYHLAEVVALSKGEITVTRQGENNARTTYADTPYRRMVNEWLDLLRRLHLDAIEHTPLAGAERASIAARADELDARIKREQQLAISNVEITLDEAADLTPASLADDPELRDLVERFRRAGQIIDTHIAALRAANDRLRADIDDLRDLLRPMLDGKFVFLGFAATAQGDIVATPIDARTNGVMCHANVFNGILQRHFIRPAGKTTDVSICLAMGIAVSLITASLGPRIALAASLAIMAVHAGAVAEIAFRRQGIWLHLAAPQITTFVTWASVTLFRQLTAEREKRFFAKQLSQYTAPAIAAKIAESPVAARAFKTVQTREVTCLFTDLAGFTTITEKENAETVQFVLNTYLERMSHVIWSRRGLLNKFMGDGIMAFYNASVDPLDDHPFHACESMLEAFKALDDLKREQKNGPAGSVFDQLDMRAGLATGLCKNGDLGSELKADYTVIGDVVNIAARLEPANKVFGTRLMVSEPTRLAVQEHYEFRYLAELQVKGKARTVPVYELVCRKGELADDQRDYIERFAAGVELYKQRKWDACIVHFTRMLSRRFDDPGASRYIDACQEFKTFPPPEDWTGALELKEK